MLCAYRVSDYSQRADSGKAADGGGRFFFTSEGCNEIVRSLTLMHPESIVDVVARAESLMDGSPSGEEDPGTSFVLARAYRYCGDPRFLNRLEQMMSPEDGRKSGASPAYDQEVMSRAARVISDTYAFHLAGESGHPVEDKLLKDIRARCSRLIRTRQKARPLARVMAAGAAAMAALSLPPGDASERHREWGLATLSELAGQYTFPSRPISLGERCLVAEVYLSLIILTQRHRLDVPSTVLGSVEAVIDSIGEVPDVPAMGRGGEIVLDVVPFESHGSREAILALGAVLFDRPDLSEAGVEAGETLLWLLGIGGMEEFEALFAVGAEEMR